MPSLTRVKKPPLAVEVGGKEYLLPTLKLSSLRRIQAYLDNLPSPVDRVLAYAGKLPEAERALALAEARAEMKAWPPQLGSAESMAHISTVAGLDLVLKLMIRQGQPGLSDEQVAAVAGELDLADVQGVLDHALGLQAEESADGPKPADPAAAGPAPTPAIPSPGT